MVPKKSRFCPKGPNFAIVASFQAKSQIPNPVSERLTDVTLVSEDTYEEEDKEDKDGHILVIKVVWG